MDAAKPLNKPYVSELCIFSKGIRRYLMFFSKILSSEASIAEAIESVWFFFLLHNALDRQSHEYVYQNKGKFAAALVV